MEDNLRFMQDYADAQGVALRPHTKTHKMPAIALMQMELGAAGIAVAKANKAARVTMVDVNRRALGLCQENCTRNGVTAEVIESDGMAEVLGRKFDAIVTNPPIRAGKQVIYKMFADAAASLHEGGALYLVIRKQQGAPSALKFLKELYGKAEVIERDGGYWIIACTSPRGMVPFSTLKPQMPQMAM